MNKLKFIISALVLCILITGLFIWYLAISEEKIQLGVWTEGLYDAKARKLQPNKLIDFEKITKKKYSIAHYYRGWESFIDSKLINEFETLREYGWTPMINANPYYFKECPYLEKSIYKAIAEGNCDKFLHNAGKNLSNVGQPFYLLFAWEMNNADVEWSVPYTRSSSQDFVEAWRHIHNIFEEENARNIIWVFCPNIPNVPQYSYQDLYPGDSFVDWTCLDGYNWGNTQSWSQWASFSGVFTSSYKLLSAIAPEKPMMIGEVNTTDQGGNKAGWYESMFKEEIPEKFPKIKAVVIFNEDRSAQEKVNWKVDISSESLNAFIDGVNSSYYK